MISTPRPRNPKGKGERLRHDIISAATALIGEHGQEGLTLRAIARTAGVTAPAIYDHFDDLDDVRRAVIDHTFVELAAFLARQAGDRTEPADRLDALCRAYVEFGITQPQQYAVMFGAGAMSPSPTAVPKSVETMPGAGAFELLLEAVRACPDRGGQHDGQSLHTAMAVWVALHGYVGLRVAAPDFPWPAGDALLETLVQRLVCRDHATSPQPQISKP